MKICRIQQELINVNGKIITIENGVIVNFYDLTPTEVKKLRYFLYGGVEIEEQIKKAAELYHVSVEEMMRPGRGKEIVVEARQYAMWLLKRSTSKSLQEIGDIFGGKDHATVLHAVRVINQRMETKQLLIH